VCIFRGYAQEPKPPVSGVEYNLDQMKNDTVNGISQSLHFFVNFPLIRKDSSMFGGRIRYQGTEFRNLDPNFNRYLNQLDFNAYWQKIFLKGGKFYLFGQIGLYSDLKDISGKDICFRLGASYTIKHSGKWKTGWGIAYSRQFFGHQLSPFISLEYTVNKKLKLSGLLPIKPKLTFKINEKISWITEIAGNVESYRLSASEFSNSFITTSGWCGMSSVEMKIRKHHCISVGLGYTFRQQTRYYEDANASNWKLFTISLSEKNEAVMGVKTSGIRCLLKYSFVL
jgi:hypothetical protein